jgi:hypothetical protein
MTMSAKSTTPEGQDSREPRGTWLLILVAAVGLPLGAATIGLLWLLAQSPNFTTPDLKSRVQYVGVVAILSLILYGVRSKARLLYGWIEIGVGCALAWPLTIDGASSYQRLITLAGCLYVMVRGLDNIEQGLRPKASLARPAEGVTPPK